MGVKCHLWPACFQLVIKKDDCVNNLNMSCKSGQDVTFETCAILRISQAFLELHNRHMYGMVCVDLPPGPAEQPVYSTNDTVKHSALSSNFCGKDETGARTGTRENSKAAKMLTHVRHSCREKSEHGLHVPKCRREGAAATQRPDVLKPQ